VGMVVADQSTRRAKARLESLAPLGYRAPDIEGTVDAILDGLRDCPRVAAEGTPEERKAFARAFVPEIQLPPHERRAIIRIRKFPLPAEANGGNSSFKMVAGAGFEPATFGL